MKHVAWSHSRLTAYELCPRRHAAVDILKEFAEGPSAERDFGSDLHKALEEACRDLKPLPPRFASYQDVVDKVRALPGDKLYEQRMGVTRDFEPCGFFSDDVYLRVVTDVLVLAGDRAAVLDYKTGKIKEGVDQLLLNAAVVLHYYPEVQTVDVRYWWICKGKKFTTREFHRGDLPAIWAKFLPRAQAYEAAVQTKDFPPKPSGICRKWCPVTSCSFHGT